MKGLIRSINKNNDGIYFMTFMLHSILVIEDKPVMVSSQIMLDSDQSESSSTISEHTTPHSSLNSGVRRNLLPQRRPFEKFTQNTEAPRRSLMTRLREEKVVV